jgi:Ulp1 family protease
MDPIDNSSGKEKEAKDKKAQKERERQRSAKQKVKLRAYEEFSNDTAVQSNERATVVDLTRGGITIEDVFEGPENDEVIIHKYGIPMTRKGLCKLKVGVWVNDEIINFYVGLLRDRDEELYNRSCQDPSSLPSNYQKSYFATTFFFAKLLVQGIYTYPNVARWTREVDVFSLKQILFPININNDHWTQLTIHMELKEIHYYDSMSGDGRLYLKAAMQWLQDESLHKRGLTLNSTN